MHLEFTKSVRRNMTSSDDIWRAVAQKALVFKVWFLCKHKIRHLLLIKRFQTSSITWPKFAAPTKFSVLSYSSIVNFFLTITSFTFFGKKMCFLSKSTHSGCSLIKYGTSIWSYSFKIGFLNSVGKFLEKH